MANEMVQSVSVAIAETIIDDTRPIGRKAYAYELQATVAIEAVRKSLKRSEFQRGPSGGHGERRMPSIDEMFDEALK